MGQREVARMRMVDAIADRYPHYLSCDMELPPETCFLFELDSRYSHQD